MALPITNLTAEWLPYLGIQLDWTAAADVTTGSVYDIYVLQDVLSRSPKWVQVAEAVANASLSPATSTVILSPPRPSYFFPLSAMNSLMASGTLVAPGSLAFSIIHVDSTEASSDAISISVFAPPPHPSYGASHLANNIAPDNFGQLQTNYQDSYEEIADSVAMFLGTIPGQRTVNPGYGTPDLPMNELDAAEIQTALNAEEPRALASLSVLYTDDNRATLSVSLQGGAEGNA